jgi:hypothetical protein
MHARPRAAVNPKPIRLGVDLPKSRGRRIAPAARRLRIFVRIAAAVHRPHTIMTAYLFERERASPTDFYTARAASQSASTFSITSS